MVPMSEIMDCGAYPSPVTTDNVSNPGGTVTLPVLIILRAESISSSLSKAERASLPSPLIETALTDVLLL